MKKILHVVACLERGGTEAYIMSNYRVLDKTEYKYDFFVFSKKEYPYLEEINKLGGNVFYGVPPAIKKIKEFSKSLMDVLKNNGPYDAIHTHVEFANGWVLKVAKKANVKVRISHSHFIQNIHSEGILNTAYRIFERHLINKYSNAKLSCSYLAGESLYGKKVFKKSGKVIENGIDVDNTLNTTADLSLLQGVGIPKNADLICGNITRFSHQKNQLYILDVFAEILKKRPCSYLILGGVDGGILGEVQNKVEKMGIQEKVKFIGVRQDVPKWLALIDVYLFPVLPEGFGIALLEAQASGCQCFSSTNVPQTVDVGLGIIEFNDLEIGPAEWAKKIIAKMDDFERPTKEMIKGAFTASGYDIMCSHEKIKKIYDGTEA